MARPEKVAVVEDIQNRIKSSNNIFLTDYAGLDVEQMTELRRELRKRNISYRIAKNTLIRIAVRKEGLEVLEPYLKGPTAIAFGADDANVAAKVLYESFKKREKPVVKCFYVDGNLYAEPKDLEAFAKLPSREDLYVQILMGVESPLTGLIASIEAPVRELVSVLDALVETKK